MPHAMVPNEACDPAAVRALRAKAVVPQADPLAHLVEETRGRRRRGTADGGWIVLRSLRGLWGMRGCHCFATGLCGMTLTGFAGWVNNRFRALSDRFVLITIPTIRVSRHGAEIAAVLDIALRRSTSWCRPARNPGPYHLRSKRAKEPT